MGIIEAKSCEIIYFEQNDENAISFLKENDGKTSSFLLGFGLLYNNELIKVMTFGKPRFNKNYQWEILRNCDKKDSIINNGTITLWETFISKFNVRNCVAYSYPEIESNRNTEEYINRCGFKIIRKSRSNIKIYFEGMWNGELKRIDKSFLETYGVNKILKSSFKKRL